MREPKTFAELIEDYVYSQASSPKKFAKDKFCAIPLATLEGWINGALPGVTTRDLEEDLSFLPDDIKEQAINFIHQEWAEKRGLTKSNPRLIESIESERSLGDILDDYMKDFAWNFKEKSAEDFFKTLMKEWNISQKALSHVMGFSDSYLDRFLSSRAKGKDNKMESTFMELLSNSNENAILPKSHLLNKDQFLKFSKLTNGKIDLGKSERGLNRSAINIIKKYQGKISNIDDQKEKEKIGRQAFFDVVKFYGLTAETLSFVVGEGSKPTYTNYLAEKDNFNNVDYLNNPSRVIAISKGLFPDSENLQQQFANLMVGLPEVLSGKKIFNKLITGEMKLSQAFFQSRFQAGKTRDDVAGDLNLESRNTVVKIELRGRIPHQNKTIRLFGTNLLGIKKEEDLQELEFVKSKSFQKYDPTFLDGMRKAVTKLKFVNADGKGSLLPREGLQKMQDQVGVSDDTLKNKMKNGIGPSAIRKLKGEGVLPNFVTSENKYECLVPMAKALGVPKNKRSEFSDIVFDYSELVKNKKNANKSGIKGGWQL